MTTASSHCPWSPRIKRTTAIGLTVIIAAVAYSLCICLCATDAATQYTALAAITVLCILLTGAVLQTPRYVEVNKEQVRIHLLCTSVKIDRDEIERIEHLPSGLAAVRIVGMGSFFGNVGLFHSDYCGRYYSFVTNPQDICLVYRRSKKPLVRIPTQLHSFKKCFLLRLPVPAVTLHNNAIRGHRCTRVLSVSKSGLDVSKSVGCQSVLYFLLSMA